MFEESPNCPPISSLVQLDNRIATAAVTHKGSAHKSSTYEAAYIKSDEDGVYKDD